MLKTENVSKLNSSPIANKKNKQIQVSVEMTHVTMDKNSL